MSKNCIQNIDIRIKERNLYFAEKCEGEIVLNYIVLKFFCLVKEYGITQTKRYQCKMNQGMWTFGSLLLYKYSRNIAKIWSNSKLFLCEKIEKISTVPLADFDECTFKQHLQLPLFHPWFCRNACEQDKYVKS